MEESKLINELKKYILEENKIVTYKWLSQQVNIHVNISKRLLAKFISESSLDLSICYIIGGVLPDGSHTILVGKKENVAKIKSSFKVVTTEHVYSVQKSLPDVDLKSLLYAADKTTPNKDGEEEKYSLSAIKCEDCFRRPISELRRHVLLNQKTKSTEPTTSKNTTDNKNPIIPAEKDKSTKSENNVTSKMESASPKKKGGIAAMFNNQKEAKKSENKIKVIAPQNKPKGISAFFSKGKDNTKNGVENSNNSDKSVDKSSNKDDKNTDSNSSVMINSKMEVDEIKNSDDKIECMVTEDTKENGSTSKNKMNTSTKNNDKSNKIKGNQKSGKKRKKNKDNSLPEKKRKRIVTISSDSDTNDEEDHERSPSPIEREPTPPPPISDDEEMVPATPAKKAKKKKLIEKTSFDEDGFLVTNKEYVFESSSEDEVVDKSKEDNKNNVVIESSNKNFNLKNETTEKHIPIVPKTKSKVATKKDSPQKVKQSSIMNFFGKKS